MPGIEFTSLDQLLAESQVIVPLVALTSDTRHILDRDRIGRLPTGTAIVNVARGELIDQDALSRRVLRGELRVALDVFAFEPLPADDELRDCANAILTPHCVGQTAEGRAAMLRAAIESIGRVLAGQPPLGVVNAEALPAWLARNGTKERAR